MGTDDFSIENLHRRADVFRSEISALKIELEPANDFWYPYDILANFAHLDRLLTGPNRGIFEEIRGGRIADIGGADGDNAFFLARLGNDVDIIDNAPTNFNQLRGAKRLHEAIGTNVRLFDIDLDTQFSLPEQQYDLILLLGILYHLKNPYFVLEALAKKTRHLLLSTRVTRFANDHTTLLEGIPVAYLLDGHEANNDWSNYWIFSEAGLRRILNRSGWDIQDLVRVGNTTASDPASASGDERAFVYARSTAFG